ncbi:MAG: hypothetical protein IJA12_02550 [Oscillospiraceae bacterium]|nr:hypothetical protein [Oscillospiraceae bacterium]
MTQKQAEKIKWLNRLSFISIKLDSLTSLKKTDQKNSVGFIENMPECDNPQLKETCRRIAEYQTRKTTEKYIEILNLYNQLRDEIENAIEKIPDTQYQSLLISHYIENKSWAKIAQENFFSVRTVKYQHLKAIDLLEIS